MVSAIVLAVSPVSFYFVLQFGPLATGANIAYGGLLAALLAAPALYTLAAAWTVGVARVRVGVAFAFGVLWVVFLLAYAFPIGLSGCFEHPTDTTFCTMGG